MYVTRHEDEIVGPFESWKAAQTFLDSLNKRRREQAYTEALSDPVKTKRLWAEWDGDIPETQEDTRRMKWCAKHKEPVWWYDDGSWTCMWQLVTGTSDESKCAVVNEVPKEVSYAWTTEEKR